MTKHFSGPVGSWLAGRQMSVPLLSPLTSSVLGEFSLILSTRLQGLPPQGSLSQSLRGLWLLDTPFSVLIFQDGCVWPALVSLKLILSMTFPGAGHLHSQQDTVWCLEMGVSPCSSGWLTPMILSGVCLHSALLCLNIFIITF